MTTTTKPNVTESNQYLVRFQNKAKWAKIYSYLVKSGYKNVHGYTEKFHPALNVICIDKAKKCFFGVNVTCLACSASVGKKIINFNEFI